MKKIKIVTIVGARPQFIKSAMLSHSIQQEKNQSWVSEVIVHTGQHYDHNMSQIFFEQLQIPKPKYNLNINSSSHGQMTGAMLIELEKIFNLEKPDIVVVYGDTNSTLAGALAAAKLHIPIAHIEAGLRSFNKTMPEEVNRVLTDHMSHMLFCPTKQSVVNLEQESITNNIFLVGDIMYDVVKFIRNNHELSQSNDENKLSLSLNQAPYALLTLHRAENTDDTSRLKRVLEYVSKFSIDNNLKIIFPVHPRTKKVCDEQGINLNQYTSFIISEPMSYIDTQRIISKADYVLTDSGGLQKEAYFHRVPCVTLRDETEWVETITAGWNRLWLENSYSQRQESISDFEITNNTAELILSEIRGHYNF